MAKASLNYEQDWSKLFKLDENSPSGLTWVSGKNLGKPAGYRKFKGDIPQGWVTRVNGVNYQVHRVIYTMIHGLLDNELVIDHENGDCFNNSHTNLRAVTEVINARNKKSNRRNVSGFNGVRKEYNKAGTLVYRSVWYEDNTLKSKTFNTNKYGEGAYEMAVSYRLLVIENLGYTGRANHEGNSTIS